MSRHGTSYEWIEQREDEIAALLTAKDTDLDVIRHDYRLLHERGAITDALYSDRRDRLDRIAHALLVGKSNTAALRNRGEL